MTYSILIIKNRLSKKEEKKVKLQKYLDWFKGKIPAEIVTEEIVTDFDITSATVSNGKWSGAVASNDIATSLRTVVPENKYNAVVFIFGNKLNGVQVSITNGIGGNGNLYPSTELIQLHKYDDNGKILNHELFHAFYAKAKRLGLPVVDNMDTYFRDNIFSTDNGDTNRTIALKALAPYWEQITSMAQLPNRTATITRTYGDKETFGILNARNGSANFVCKVLELPWLNNARNISCIPAGTYTVKFTRSLKFPNGTYEIQNVLNRSGIRFHKGNYAFKAFGSPDIEGCILLGSSFADINGDKVPDIVNSTITVNAFEGFFGREPFTLTIS